MARFKGFNVAAPNSSALLGGFQSVASQSLQSADTLINRLQDFHERSFVQASKLTAQKAINQAAKDDAEDKPFHANSVHTIYNDAYNNARTASYASNAELDINAQSQQISLQANSPMDYRKSMGQYVEELAKSAPTSSLSSLIRISGRKTINHTFGKLSIKKDKEVRDFRKEEYLENMNLQLSKAINAKSSNNMKDFDLIRESMETYTKTLKADGILSDAEILKIKSSSNFAIRKGVAEIRIIDLVDEGNIDLAEKEIAELSKEIPEGLNPKEWKAMVSSMNSILSASKKQINRDLKEIRSSANANIKDAIKIMKNGKYPDVPISDNELVAASPSVRRQYELQQDTSIILNNLSDLSLIEKEKALNEMASSSSANRLDIEVMNALESQLKEQRNAWEKDPQLQGQQVGLYTLEPIVINKPDSITRILNERVENIKLNIEEAGVTADRIFTNNELSLFENLIQDGTIEEKKNIIEQISKANEADKAFKELGKNKAYNLSFAGQMSLIGNESASMRVLAGGNAEIAVEAPLKRAINSKLRGVFNNFQADLFNQNFNGTIDYIKGKLLLNEDLNGSGDNGMADEAISETMGILSEYNGKRTILPYGVSKSEFNTWLDEIVIPNKPMLTEAINDIPDLILTGDSQLHYMSNGKYKIWHKNNGSGFYEEDPEDNTKDFILDYWGI